jgi:mannitol-1-/sugar-/sorbitol-6-phosphatase
MELQCSACLFDLDGVLVDSRAVVERVCRRWAEHHGLDPETVIRVAHGRRTSDTVRTLAPQLDQAREVAWLDEMELTDVDGLRAVPGVRQLLAALPAGAWAVVTSCGRDLAELRLSSVGLPIPAIMVTSEDVSRGKPSPEGYRLGARRLGVPATDCIVFEDAPPGIEAGSAAGARVIALNTTQPDGDFSGAVAVIPDFSGIRVRQGRGGITITIA